MAKFAARPEKPRPPEVTRANRAKTRVSDVDISYVVPLVDLPDLPNGNTSQMTGPDADYTYRLDEPDEPVILGGPAVTIDPVLLGSITRLDPNWRNPLAPEPAADTSDTTAPEDRDLPEPLPKPFQYLARVPLIGVGGGKFNSRGDFDFTLKVAAQDVDPAMSVFRRRRDGLRFYIDVWAIPLEEGFELDDLYSIGGDDG